MKYIRFLCLLIMAAFSISAASAEWINFECRVGGFSIVFPRNPEYKVEQSDGANGSITIHTFSCNTERFKDDNLYYEASYWNYPDTLVNSDFNDEFVDAFLEKLAEAALVSTNGKLISKQKISYKGFPCISTKIITANEKGICYIKIFLVKNRIYSMQISTLTENDKNPAIDRFFNSFTVPGWINYENKDGSFRISLPKEPKYGRDTSGVKERLIIYTFSCDNEKDDSTYYMIGYYDRPDSVINSDYKDELISDFFDSRMETAVKSVKGTIISQTNNLYRGFPARTATYNLSDGKITAVFKMIIVKSRIFCLQVFTEKQQDDDHAIDRFFNSFALLENADCQ